jgi:hypothetical protein
LLCRVKIKSTYAGVVELADTQDLGSCAYRCAGSSPVTRTIKKQINFFVNLFFYFTGKRWQDYAQTKQDANNFLTI